MSHKDKATLNTVQPFGEVASLDKLAQLGTNEKNADKAIDVGVLRKRARAKFFSKNLTVKLAQIPESHLTKSYWNTFYCTSALVQQGDKLTSHYCGNRWCSVCNRIRTAKLIAGYSKPLGELTDKHFVTLTIPNVPESDLKGAIDQMNHSFKKICETFKKRRQRGLQTWQIRGIKKIECTYNPVMNNYHPHYHLIVEGKTSAEAIVEEWLKRMPGTSYKAQDIRPATNGATLELFKYFTKVVTKVGTEYKTYTRPLDVIFRAIWGCRIFQPIGIKKDVEEDIEGIITQDVDGLTGEFRYWKWDNSDWVDYDTGEALTGYMPSDSMEQIVQNIQ